MTDDAIIVQHQTRAKNYDAMALAMEEGQDTSQISRQVPRGKPLAWYREQAQSFRDRADGTAALARFEADEARRQTREALPPELGEVVEAFDREGSTTLIRSVLDHLPLTEQIALLEGLLQDLRQGL